MNERDLNECIEVLQLTFDALQDMRRSFQRMRMHTSGVALTLDDYEHEHEPEPMYYYPYTYTSTVHVVDAILSTSTLLSSSESLELLIKGIAKFFKIKTALLYVLQ